MGGGESALCSHLGCRLLLNYGTPIFSAFFLKVALSIVVSRLTSTSRWQMADERMENGFGSFQFGLEVSRIPMARAQSHGPTTCRGGWEK